MYVNSKLNKLVGAVGTERFIINSIINKYSTDVLLQNFETLCISNKTKRSLSYLNSIVVKKEDLLSSISGLTEIPKKTLIQYETYNKKNILHIFNHPENLDIDARQFEKLRLLREIIKSYENELEDEHNNFSINQDEMLGCEI